jgi:hypothetical protein
MNTAHNPFSTGTINFGGVYMLTFCTGDGNNWIDLYDANRDDTATRMYSYAEDLLQSIPLLMASETMREEMFK